MRFAVFLLVQRDWLAGLLGKGAERTTTHFTWVRSDLPSLRDLLFHAHRHVLGLVKLKSHSENNTEGHFGGLQNTERTERKWPSSGCFWGSSLRHVQMCPEDQEGLDLITPNSAAKRRTVCVRRQAAPDAVPASRPGSSRLSAGILFSPAVKVQAASFPPSSVTRVLATAPLASSCTLNTRTFSNQRSVLCGHQPHTFNPQALGEHL